MQFSIFTIVIAAALALFTTVSLASPQPQPVHPGSLLGRQYNVVGSSPSSRSLQHHHRKGGARRNSRETRFRAVLHKRAGAADLEEEERDFIEGGAADHGARGEVDYLSNVNPHPPAAISSSSSASSSVKPGATAVPASGEQSPLAAPAAADKHAVKHGKTEHHLHSSKTSSKGKGSNHVKHTTKPKP